MSDPIPAVQARIPPRLQAAVEEELQRAATDRVAERLPAADASLWAPPGTPEVADRLGWLTIAERMLAEVDALEEFAAEVAAEGVQDVVLLGMGGSSLAPEVLRRSFGHQPGRPRLSVLDSTDAQAIAAVGAAVDPRSTLFIVSSKSGGTIEPLSLFAHFWPLAPDGRRFIAITDPGSGLERLAAEHGFRRTFSGDPQIGGRYSALSAFGMVPAALMGADVRALLGGAAGAARTVLAEQPGAQGGAAVWLGSALSGLARAGREKLTFLIAPTLPGLGLWLEQLVAESTGKHATGILPVADEPLGPPAAYGEDRVFVHMPDVGAPDQAMDELAAALADAGHPVITMPVRSARDLGRIFLAWETAVAVAGWGLGINPFDQPNVQQAKDATTRVLADYEARGQLTVPATATGEQLRSLLLGASPPQYVAIMAYTRPTAEFDAAAAQLRAAVRGATAATTTFGYGPRFLHSTGQFHKGGPPTGRFLQLLHDGPEDVAIPGAPYTFTTLKEAQAIGDLSTLRELSLPAERVRLPGADPAGALRALAASVGAPGGRESEDASQASEPR